MSVTTSACAFHAVCAADDLWSGEMECFEAGGTEILLIKLDDGFRAYQAVCPHQDIPLVEGKLEKGVLTCRAHLWQFAADTGKGVNPSNCRLKQYPVEVEDGMVRVGDRPLEETDA